MQDTRRFTRLPAASRARLTLPDIDIDGELQDISLKGALMLCVSQAVPEQHLGHAATLTILLNEGEVVLTFAVRIAHLEDHFAGIEFLEMDLDTKSHLRRLVELNLGSDETLQRELGMLWDNRNSPNQ